MSIRSLSEVIEDYCAGLSAQTTSVQDILEAFHERGLGIILILFATPMALPIPVPPGINIALATPLILLTLQQAMGAHTVWLPKGMKAKTFDSENLKNMLLKIVPFLRKVEFLLRPRLSFITSDGASRLMGALGVIMALTVCIPLPLTNTVPSFGITLMALGFMSRDGLAVLAGAMIGTAWVAMLAITIFIFGPEAFDIIKEFIKSFL